MVKGNARIKMTAWRLSKLETNDAFANMAIDEAIVTARIEGLVPNTLRFYRWNPSTVSIGRFQKVFNEVHVENCRSHGVDIVRRITGGGTVYHDFEGEITYSVVVKEEDLGTQDVVVAYNTISNGLIEAAKILGVNANFNPGDPRNCPNIAIDGKKISGSAQFHKGGVLLQHGTLLLDIDLTKMFTFLKVPWAKTITDVICVAKERITSIKHELASNISMEEAYQALIRGFQKAFDIEFNEEETLTTYEQKLAEKLRKEKYTTEKWNLEGKVIYKL
ncbi:MAG: lipoate--protein ligase family protein [Candidatus Bathyarchaeota archaeon]|nr:lipoate--protein ligase family protein [Candidatus Bathyarchaeota archaeon]